ncbi:hypothetical protein LINPERHAP2_LOCUS3432, partial [Linum perenne]
MLRPCFARTWPSSISFSSSPNSAPFVGECSWGFKLSIATGIFQKARAICWLVQKHASVVPGARSGARGWLRAGPSSILAKPSALCFGQVFRNALMGSSRAGAGTGIEA